MSANNTIRANGFVELAATHDAARNVWQGKDFGQRLVRGASVEEWAKAAGLDWSVQRSVVRFATERGQDGALWAEFPDQHVLMRSDTKAPMGIVSAGYKVHQPLEILQTLKNEATRAGYELETAGSLHGGAIIWAMASDGVEAEIGKGDRILSRTLLKTNTNGNGATEGYETTVCVVCSNTMRAATAGRQAKARITHRSKYDAGTMAHKLGLTHSGAFATYVDNAKRLADKQVSKDRAERLLLQLLAPQIIVKPAPTLAELEAVTDSLAFKKIMNLFNGEGMGATMDGRKGTAWGFLNAITEYSEHHVRARSESHRTESSWFGAGDKLKSDAGELVLSLI